VDLILQYLPIVLFFSLFLFLWIFLFAFRKYHQLKRKRAPFARDLLRSPGQSLLKKIDALNSEIIIHSSLFFLAPVLFYALYITQRYITGRMFDLTEVIIIGGLGAVFLLVTLLKVVIYLKRRRLMRLGYDGELAVGQELNQLVSEGYRVYHDFPADNFNIDHIVVGKKGVFAVETIVRLKRTTKNRQKDATVEYNGRVLYYPQGKDLHTIEQAERQAEWFSKWMGSAIGEQVYVRAIVALPGWYVKRISPEGIPVVNPKQFSSLFKHIEPRLLSEEVLTRIVHQLEQKCRDVQPVSKIINE
jgi:hypothetical protein